MPENGLRCIPWVPTKLKIYSFWHLVLTVFVSAAFLDAFDQCDKCKFNAPSGGHLCTVEWDLNGNTRLFKILHILRDIIQKHWEYIFKQYYTLSGTFIGYYDVTGAILRHLARLGLFDLKRPFQRWRLLWNAESAPWFWRAHGCTPIDINPPCDISLCLYLPILSISGVKGKHLGGRITIKVSVNSGDGVRFVPP